MEIGPVGHSVMKVSCLTPSCYCRHVVAFHCGPIYLVGLCRPEHLCLPVSRSQSKAGVS